MNFQLIATCPDELKDLLATQIESIGGTNIQKEFKHVSFNANEEVFYKAHLKLSIASQLFWVLKQGSGSSREIIYNQASKVQWQDIFSPKHTFRVDGVAGDRGEGALHSNEISKRVRQAIEHKFLSKNTRPPRVALKDTEVVIKAFVYRKRLTLSVCTSGKSMHKRGYRLGNHPAPMKETLAASILEWVNYKGDVPLVDPMCGSGTIAIEAAMKALNKSCLIHRKKGEFSFEKLKVFNSQIWRKVQDEARNEKANELPQPIIASDLEANFSKDAKQNALKARVEKYIEFRNGNFLDSTPEFDCGLLVMNLPYGARLEKETKKLATLYNQIGSKLKHDYPGWKAVLVTSEEAPIKEIGLKPKRKKKVLNGSIKTVMLEYELFKGKRKANKSQANNLA